MARIEQGLESKKSESSAPRPVFLKSIGAFECALTPSLVRDDGHRIGKVETAIARAHRDSQLSLAREAIEHVDGKSAGFRSEKKGIAGLEVGGEARCAGAGRESENSKRRDARQKNVEILVLLYPGRLVIIKTGATKACLVQIESQGVDEMQTAAGVGAKPYDIPGIGRNFRLIENDVKHDPGSS